MIEDCTNLICSIDKEAGIYRIIDCNKTEIWMSNTNKPLKLALKEKTYNYAVAHSDSYNKDDPCIWILKTVSTNNNECEEYSFKNIAVCKSKGGLIREINSHVNHLVNRNSKTEKAKSFRSLWQDDIISIEFRELVIEKYISSIFQPEWSSEDYYIKSLVFPDYKAKTNQAKYILKKQRAEYVEGRIAFECNMKKSEGNGIWEPSGFGIDGEIYEYYRYKTLK